MAIDWNQLKPQLRVGGAILGLALVAWIGRNMILNRAVARGRERIAELDARLAELDRARDEVTALRAEVSPETIAAEKERLSRVLLSPAVAHGLVDRVREVCRAHASPSFETKVRELAPVPLEPGSKRWKLPIAVSLATEWEKLGPLLAELRAIPEGLVIEDAALERDFPLVRVELVLAAPYAEGEP
jgi:hypothetical protein